MKITRRQKTPVHDHMVWGMVGVLRGAESCEEFALVSEEVVGLAADQLRSQRGSIHPLAMRGLKCCKL